MNAMSETLTPPDKVVAALDVERIRADFPVLDQRIHDQPLVYLDNGATTQKPVAVLEAMDRLYREDYANVRRGVHELSLRATRKFEAARETCRQFLNAADSREIIFVRGATEAINLVAQAYGRKNIGRGDEILISQMEHHSNIVPWQMLAEQTGAIIRMIPMNEAGELLLDEYHALLSPKTKLVAVGHLSNALGTINPVQEMIRLAHEYNAPVVVDGAQATAHCPVDVQALDCDFYTFSGHKLYGPSGIGVLYGKLDHLQTMDPYHGGGDMIQRVTFKGTEYAAPPAKFEAGTPDIAGVIGLGAAIDYVTGIGLDAIAAHEQDLLSHATKALEDIQGVRIIGTAGNKASILSFLMDSAHAHDIGTIMDTQGIAIRAGHHCAMPVMQFYGVPATARAAFGIYNTRAEVDALMAGIKKVKEVFDR